MLHSILYINVNQPQLGIGITTIVIIISLLSCKNCQKKNCVLVDICRYKQPTQAMNILLLYNNNNNSTYWFKTTIYKEFSKHSILYYNLKNT